MKNRLKEELNARLSGIKMDVGQKQRVLNQMRKEEEPVMKKKMSLAGAIAMALIVIAAAAFALTEGFGLFDLMGKGKKDEFSQVQKEAYDLMQKNVASVQFDHVDVSVTEAVYDGEYLRILYSTKLRDAAVPFDEDKIYNGEFNFEAAEEDGVWWYTMDFARVNGQDVSPMEADAGAGGENGQTLAWIQFDLSEIDAGNELKVILPIRGRKSIENEELSFTMQVKDLPGVRYVKLIPDVRFSDYTLSLIKMIISPIRVYARAEITVDAGVTAQRCDEIMEKWMADGVLKGEGGEEPLISSGGSSRYLENTEYTGEDFRLTVIDDKKPVRMAIDFEFLTRESYPDTFILTNGMDSLTIPNQV